jgi:hypothetical protein
MTLEQLRADIKAVVEYSLPSEEADFERAEHDGDDTDRHVVHALRRLDAFVEEETMSDSIYTLMTQVREHPDYVFGTVFTVEDFPEGVPDSFSESKANDALVERGNEFIEASS